MYRQGMASRVGIGTNTRADQYGIKLHNLGLVMSLIQSSPEGMSRADIARASGLTRSTASRLVQDLLDLRIVVEQRTLENREPGRPATPVTVAPGSYVGLGATVNVDYAAVRAIDLAGNVVFEKYESDDFAESDPAQVLRHLGAVMAQAVAECEAAGIVVTGAGLGVPGLIDNRPDGQLLEFAPNLGWRHISPRVYLGRQLQMDVAIDNDANLQAVAAAYSAPGLRRSYDNFLYISGDIGVGGSLVIDGEVFRGAHGFAGEVGHTMVDPNGPICHCGARGCLETFVGRPAILAAAGLPATASVLELESALEAGDSRSLSAVAVAGEKLGIAVSNAVNLLDIPTIVLGTGLGRILEWLRPSVLEVLGRRFMGRGNVEVQLVGAALDEAPAATGAAYLALRNALEHAVARVNP